MENIENIVTQRQRLIAQRAEIDNEIKLLSSQIVDTLGVFEGSQEIAGYSVSVGTKRTFKPAIAEQMLAKKRMNKAVRESLYKQELDAKKVKALFPDIYAEAQVEGATFPTVREV